MRDNPFGPWTTALSPIRGASLSTYWVRRLTTLPHLGQSLPTLYAGSLRPEHTRDRCHADAVATRHARSSGRRQR